jgi:hypothetical protein
MNDVSAVVFRVIALLAAADARGAGTAAAPAPAVAESSPTRADGPAQLRGFMDLVAAESPPFYRDDYRFHPARADAEAGFCVDIRLKSKLDARRYYAPADAIAFLLAVDRVAARTGARWRILYDDQKNVGEVVARRAKRGSLYVVARSIAKLDLFDFHGPGEMKLHMHLDVSLDPPPPTPDDLHGQGALKDTMIHSTKPGR